MTPKFRAHDKKTNKIHDVKEIDYTPGFEGVYFDIENEHHYRHFEVVDLMQSTGLFDKNGKEIFEGDVVKCYIVTEKGEYEYVGVVCLKDFAFVIVDEKDTYDPLWNYKSGFVDIETEIEIIGNIYESPELLEVKQ